MSVSDQLGKVYREEEGLSGSSRGAGGEEGGSYKPESGREAQYGSS